MISSAFAGQLLSVACYNEPSNPPLESRHMRDRATVRETHFKAFSRSWRVLSGTEGPPPREVFWINRSAATPSSRALSSAVGALHCQLLQTAVAGAEVLLGASEGHQAMPSLITRRLCSMSGSGSQSGRFYREDNVRLFLRRRRRGSHGALVKELRHWMDDRVNSERKGFSLYVSMRLLC